MTVRTQAAANPKAVDTTRRSSYVPELDGIRGIAIGGVMALHFVGTLTITTASERVASKLAGYGVWGVDLFFVLSGFLITGILIQSKGSAHYLRNFYVRRTLRIFPLYYVVLALLCLAVPARWMAWIDPQLAAVRSYQPWLWPYLTNFYLGPSTEFSVPYVSHFWSLAIEEHFYLFWPFIIMMLSRRSAMRACVAFSAVSVVLRFLFLALDPNALYWQLLTPCRLDALCVGAWFALSASSETPLAAKTALRWMWGSASGIVLLSLWNSRYQPPLAWILPPKTALLAVFFGLVIYLASRPSGFIVVKAALRAGWLRTLGKYSYGLYVYHGIIAYAFHQHPPRALYAVFGSHTIAATIQVALQVAISMVIAVISYRLFESRFLELKKYFEATEHKARPVALSQTVASTNEPQGTHAIGLLTTTH